MIEAKESEKKPATRADVDRNEMISDEDDYHVVDSMSTAQSSPSPTAGKPSRSQGLPTVQKSASPKKDPATSSKPMGLPGAPKKTGK